MKARFTKEIGTRIYLRRYWDGDCLKMGYHNAMRHIKDIPEMIENNHHGGNPEDYADEMWPTTCENCGAAIPETAKRQVFNKRWYDTASGNLEPGCLFWINWYPDNFFWDNHKGPHLCAVLPNGHHWVIDSRAANCTMPNDRQHRCWVRHGDPEKGIVHVDKNGLTCSAGAGSIGSGSYHGFLHNGIFT